jgi:hypothetical protein
VRYRLRTLLIVLALCPPLLWAGWLAWSAIAARAAPQEADLIVEVIECPTMPVEISCSFDDEPTDTGGQTASPDEN